MDEDRIEGSGKKVKGDIKDKAGQILGDDQLRAEGKGDKAEGRVQKAGGHLKDTAREVFGGKH